MSTNCLIIIKLLKDSIALSGYNKNPGYESLFVGSNGIYIVYWNYVLENYIWNIAVDKEKYLMNCNGLSLSLCLCKTILGMVSRICFFTLVINIIFFIMQVKSLKYEIL